MQESFRSDPSTLTSGVGSPTGRRLRTVLFLRYGTYMWVVYESTLRSGNIVMCFMWI